MWILLNQFLCLSDYEERQEENPMVTYTHLNLEDRIRIQMGITAGDSLNKIARSIGRSRSTVAREIRNNRNHMYKGAYGRSANNCRHRTSCRITGICDHCHYRSGKCSLCGKCNSNCSNYLPEVCPSIAGAPFCCNACKKLNNCTLSRFRYEADIANKIAEKRLRDQRIGTTLSDLEICFIDELVSPLLLNGQSLHHIYVNHADQLPCSERTLYTLVDIGALRARNIDMPRKVRRRLPRQRREHKVEANCRQGRNYEDYLHYLEKHPGLNAVQMDTVVGCADSRKVLLTLYWPQAQFLLIRLRERNTARSVCNCFDELEMILGIKSFRKLFPLCLTDNGSEFSQPSALEQHDRTFIFYCDPLMSNQKAELERDHQFIRAVCPKGTSFDNLEQTDLDLLASHVNSYCRPSLGDKTPYEIFECIFGTTVLGQLGIQRIPPDDICLKPALLSRR